MKENEVVIVEEICKECNLKERILIKMNRKLFIKVYHMARIKIFNSLNN